MKPTERKVLQQAEGVSPRLVERYGDKLLQAVASGLELPEAELPNFPRTERRAKDPEVDKRMDKLKAWRIKASVELGLDAGVLINNATLNELARKKPQTACDLKSVELLKNWQRQVLGEGILQILN